MFTLPTTKELNESVSLISTRKAEDLSQSIRLIYPISIEIQKKTNSRLMKLIAKLFGLAGKKVREKFMSGFYTSFFGKIYVPEDFYTEPVERTSSVMNHEACHLIMEKLEGKIKYSLKYLLLYKSRIEIELKMFTVSTLIDSVVIGPKNVSVETTARIYVDMLYFYIFTPWQKKFLNKNLNNFVDRITTRTNEIYVELWYALSKEKSEIANQDTNIQSRISKLIKMTNSNLISMNKKRLNEYETYALIFILCWSAANERNNSQLMNTLRKAKEERTKRLLNEH